MSTYTGGCHCGAVRYQVNMELQSLMACNCSRCSKLGWLMAFVPAADFTLLQGEDKLTDYRFNKEIIAHLFCRVCGVESFARGKNHDGSDAVAVNVRCLDNIDVKAFEVKEFDGRAL